MLLVCPPIMTKKEDLSSSKASTSIAASSTMGVARAMSSEERAVTPVSISFSKLKRSKGRRSRIVAEEIKTDKSPQKPVSNPEEETPSSVENDSSSNSCSSDQLVNPIEKSVNPTDKPVVREEYQPECEDVSRISSPVEQDIEPPIQDSPNEIFKEESETSEENSNLSVMLEGRDSIQIDQAPVPEEMIQTASANRKKGRPTNISSEDSISPDETPTESQDSTIALPTTTFENAKNEDSSDSVLPKRNRVRPKRFAIDEEEAAVEPIPKSRARAKGTPPNSKRNQIQDDTSSDSSSVPSKKKRGRPPKGSDVTLVMPVVANRPDDVMCDADVKDPVEEDLSLSSSDVTLDRWYNSEAVEAKPMNPTPGNDSSCPSPALSSASSSIGSCTDSPKPGPGAASAKRSRGRPQRNTNNIPEKLDRVATIVEQNKSFDRPQSILTPPNGISPRKLHKKFGKFCPPPFNKAELNKTEMNKSEVTPNGLLSDTDSPAKEAPSTPDISSMSSPVQSMKVKSRWGLASIEQQEMSPTHDSPTTKTPSTPNQSKPSSKESSRAPTPSGVTPTKTMSVDLKPMPEVDINTLEETKVEIKERLSSFCHITENTFLCERRYNKESRDMDCDCTMSKEDNAKGRKGCGNDCLNRLLFIECGKSCSLGKKCSNKRFQTVENAATEVFKTDYKGFGVRATQDLSPDTFLMEYVGEVLDPRQFRKRARKYASDDVQHFYFMALSSEYFVDASSKGNISRFINHSCDPNAETQKWTVNGELRVGFFSRRWIKKGEEITFDYKYERYGQEAQKCYCGAKICRGWLGGEPDKENRKPVAEVESDDDYWSSTTSDEEDESAISKQQQPQQQQQRDQEPTSPVVRFTNQLSKLKKLRRQKLLRTPRKIKNYENQEYEEEIERLKATGIRTKTHIVELCRLMVRVTDLNTKLTLASLIRTADNPCRRLFLDYHGLKILNSWMSELGYTLLELDLKIAIENTLSALSIPHKTMLVDSKVWQTITRWSNPDVKAHVHVKVQSTESSRATTPDLGGVQSTPSKLVNASLEAATLSVNQVAVDNSNLPTPSVSPKAEIFDLSSSPSKKDLVKCDSTVEMSKIEGHILQTQEDVDMKDVETKPLPDSSADLLLVKNSEISTSSDEVVADKSTSSPEIKREESEIIPPALDSQVKAIVEIVSSQTVENQDLGFEKMDESSPVDVAPVSKSEQPTPEKESDTELDTKMITVRARAIALLAQWINLQEVFKIPKKELLALRAEHEREVDRAAAAASEHRADHFSNRALPKPITMPSGYERANNRPHRPDSPTKRERRLSRFDDQTGLLNANNLSREHRRHIFSMKAELEQVERRKRSLLQQQHENKCYYLRLDPVITPMFPQYPDFYFDPSSSQWHQMPEAYPKVDNDWGYSRMALLPLEAFKVGDAPLPDPAFIYPPGVVPVSYCFGHPMSLDPSLLPVAPPLPPMPPPVDLEEIPLPTPQPTSYFDPSTGEEVPIQEMMSGWQPDWADEAAVAGSTTSALSRPDTAPHLQSALETALTNGFSMDPKSWLAKSIEAHPPYLAEHESQPSSQLPQHLDRPVILPGFVPIAQAVSTTPSAAPNGKKATSEKVEILVKLPRHWKMAKDSVGRPYYYHVKTKETRWDPPAAKEEAATIVVESVDDITVVEMETASTDSDGPGDEVEEDGEDSDDEDEDDSDKEEEEENGNGAIAEKLLNHQKPENAILNTTGDVLYSDLSAHEKELLLKTNRKKSKEERQNERRYKRERDREKREYERKRRRERHGKHRRDGLVQEHLIPRRTERDKIDLMSLKELKDRLANRVQIREEQEMEEMAEMEREKEEERSRRIDYERKMKSDRDQATAALAAIAAAVNRAEFSVLAAAEASCRPTTAAADTSSEVVKKIKDRFLKEASKVIVKLLDPYRRPGAPKGYIQNVDDFKHLAKKLTNYLLTKESSRCKRIEDLKFSDSVKKKSADFVKKYMAKFGEAYKRSPPSH